MYQCGLTLLGPYVDDGAAAGPRHAVISYTSEFADVVQLMNRGILSQFLGVKVHKARKDGSTPRILEQKEYCQMVVKAFEADHKGAVRPYQTPGLHQK